MIDSTTSLCAIGRPVNKLCIAVAKVVAGTSAYHTPLSRFPDIMRPTGVNRPIKHNVMHHIETTPGNPVFSRPRRLSTDRLQAAKTEFKHLLQKGLIRPSKWNGFHRCIWHRKKGKKFDLAETSGDLRHAQPQIDTRCPILKIFYNR